MEWKSKSSHLVDVSFLSKRYLRQSVTSSILLFNLSDLGLDNEFLEGFKGTYSGLNYDLYDVSNRIEEIIKERYPRLYLEHQTKWIDTWNNPGPENRNSKAFWGNHITDRVTLEEIHSLRPNRKRSCFLYQVKPSTKKNAWVVEERGVPVFKQKVSDSRQRSRYFSPPRPNVFRNTGVLKIVASICQMIKNHASTPLKLLKNFNVTMHQIVTYVMESSTCMPAPEGIHQDGAHFIVSAIVIERRNVEGGVSQVYYTNHRNSLAFEHLLEPGEGIFQSDLMNDYWHDVTPISKIKKHEQSYRSILGFDVEISYK